LEVLDSWVKALTKKKEGEGKCSNRFGIDKFEEYIFVII
jgi:hypothetical protein